MALPIPHAVIRYTDDTDFAVSHEKFNKSVKFRRFRVIRVQVGFNLQNYPRVAVQSQKERTHAH
ncbi:MAG: hypothetical protein JETCAE02_13950 [Anaerolineaceae bacterium]|nr:MAG: hypothetical protein JETCAE02_13950 [Anaerolineaceae bacterium]